MSDPGEIARFHDRCSDLMRELLDGLAQAPDRPRPFPEIEDAIGWPRRRIASVLGGVSHLRHTEFGGRRPYRFLSDRESASGRWEMWMDAAQARAARAADEGVRSPILRDVRQRVHDPELRLMATDWRLDGVRVVHAGELDPNTPQTPGMHREAAIDAARAGAEKLWAGTVVIHADAKTGPHHHGELESVIYVVSGKARMRWGERLEFTAEAGPGDFIYVPPYVPHQEINASPDDSLSCVVVRSGQEPVVVNLDMPAVEPNPEDIHWVDDIHKAP
jgi:uncharacterized RmlC-like cupin family protein